MGVTCWWAGEAEGESERETHADRRLDRYMGLVHGGEGFQNGHQPRSLAQDRAFALW